MKIQEGFGTIDRFDGYRIHSSGYVESCWSNGGKKINRWKRLKPDIRNIDSGGYECVTLRLDTMEYLRIQISHLVLEAFVGPRPGELVACHWDGNPRNNDISNLRWDTRKANEEDKKRHGTHQTGSMNPAAKLDEDRVIEMRRLYATGNYTTYKLSDMFGISRRVVSQTLKHKLWKHVQCGQNLQN